MARSDIKVLRPSTFGTTGTRRLQVAADASFPTINEGEPVAKALGAAPATSLATGTPVVGTDFLAGISLSESNESATEAGVVDVLPLTPGTVYICDANSAVDVSTQALYDALVGLRVLFDKTGDVYTVLGTDGATNGIVIEDLDVSKHEGKIAFSIRAGANYLA